MSELGELAARFTALYTGALADVLDKRGLMHQTLPAGLAPLRPRMRLAGPAEQVDRRRRHSEGQHDDGVSDKTEGQ